MLARESLLALALAAAACGGKPAEEAGTKDDARPAAVGSSVAPIATPAVGVDAIRRMNFVWGDATKDHQKAVAAYNAKPRDWAAVRAASEAALAKDAHHLDAHRLIGSALAHDGEHAAAVDHLVTALAGDYWKYAPLAKDEDLAGLLATPHGAALAEVEAKIRAEYERRAANAVFVVGRRSAFKWPAKPGAEWASSRGEVYAYDRESKRYLRLTHTDHQVAGFVRAPAGDELALLGFDKIDRPATAAERAAMTTKKKGRGKDAAKDPPKAADDAEPAVDQPPLIARGWVEVVDTKTWQRVGARAVLPAARALALGYAGDALRVSIAPAAGRWGTGPATVSGIDRKTGKLVKADAAEALVPRIELSLEEAAAVRPDAGIVATYAGAIASSFKTAAGGTVQVPESGQVARHTIVTAPGDARVAFPTVVDPCATSTAPSLYVADAKTGTLRHVLTARSFFGARWLDATTLAYEDGDGSIRLWDAAAGREAMRIENKPGIALDVLALAPGPLCKQGPPAAAPEEPAGPDDAMPPEE